MDLTTPHMVALVEHMSDKFVRIENHIIRSEMLRGGYFSGELFNRAYDYNKGFEGNIDPSMHLLVILRTSGPIVDTHCSESDDFKCIVMDSSLVCLLRRVADFWDMDAKILAQCEARGLAPTGTMHIDLLSSTLYWILRQESWERGVLASFDWSSLVEQSKQIAAEVEPLFKRHRSLCTKELWATLYGITTHKVIQ